MSVVGLDREPRFKLHELRCFDAVVRLGGFQAAADALGRTHPSVFAAVGRLEGRLGFALFDRSGYRVALTPEGEVFHVSAAQALRDVVRLGAFAERLRRGREPVLRIVLGDLCPRASVLPVLAAFFAARMDTRLHLDCETVSGPTSRLREGSADLIFHRAEETQLQFERIVIAEVRLIPVAAPGFLPSIPEDGVSPERLRRLVQCVLRDTSGGEGSEDHFLVDGSHRCSVPDQATKKDLIMHRLAWGHLPEFLIADELRNGALISLRNPRLPGRLETVVAARRRGDPLGPVAAELWAHLAAAFGKGGAHVPQFEDRSVLASSSAADARSATPSALRTSACRTG